VEYRTRPTRIIGERFYIYATKKPSAFSDQLSARKMWSRDLRMPDRELPAWMLELAEQVGMIEPGTLLPTGVIVGSAVIEKVSQVPSAGSGQAMYRWHLADVARAKKLRKPRGHPQPVWFRSF